MTKLADDFVVNIGTDLKLSNASYSIVGGNQLVLNLGSKAVIANAPTINITDNAANVDIQDASGNNAKPSANAFSFSVSADKVAPTLNSVVWVDADKDANVSALDQLVFTFSEAMDTSNAYLLANGNTAMITSLGVSDTNACFGDSAHFSWSVDNKTLTVTLGGKGICGIKNGLTFSPNLTDLAGNAVATMFAPVLSISDTSAPVINNCGISKITNTDATMHIDGVGVGVCYYLVEKAADASSPDAAAIKTDGKTAQLSSGSNDFTGLNGGWWGLDKDTPYVIHMVLEDTAGNSAGTQSINFATTTDSVIEADFSPVFDGNTFTYTYGNNSLDITAAGGGQITGWDVDTDSSSAATVATSSVSVPLATGTNTITIKVTKADTEKTYQITIKK